MNESAKCETCANDIYLHHFMIQDVPWPYDWYINRSKIIGISSWPWGIRRTNFDSANGELMI